ncbi:MAG: acyl carrier protein [Bacillota bacterium]|nr:acyl carrier protein [Bacillota bacterium]
MSQQIISDSDLIANVAKIAKLPKEEVTMDLKIYNSPIVSSLAIMEIMTFVEKEYRIVIKSEELIEENFGDVLKLKSFVERKLQDK